MLSLALGIGATTAVFSFVNAIQFRPLPVRDEASLVTVGETSATELCDGCDVGTSYPAFLDLRSRAQSFEALDAYAEDRFENRFVVSGGSAPERVGAAYVSAGLFRTIGVQPSLGRDFSTEDDRVGAAPVVVISDMIWRRRFGGDPGVLGRTLKVNGIERTIVGVMPPRFAFPEYAQLWAPIAPAAQDWKRDNRALGVIGRLRAGVSFATASAEVATIGSALAATYPEHRRWGMAIESLRRSWTGETAMASLVLLSSVAFVLLIACANVANLLLVRAADRRREIAIRIAVGASASHIVRLVLTESIALSAIGGGVGLLVALWVSDGIIATFGANAPYWIQFGIDARVLLFGVGATLLTGIICGVVPAVQSMRPDVNATLRNGGTATAGSHRFRSVLVAGQLALALVLLAGAGLLVKTTIRTFQFTPGFETSRVLAGDVQLSGSRYQDEAQIVTFSSQLVESLERIPGVRAAMDRTIFFRGFGAEGQRITVDGLQNVPADASPSFYHAVTSGYFRALGMPIRHGRDFVPSDMDAVIVNTEMARRLWGSADALGHRLRFGDAAGGRWFTVIGVVNIRGGSPLAAQPDQPTAFVPLRTLPGQALAIIVGSDRDPAPLAAEVRAAVAGIDPDQPVEELMTMDQMYAQWTQPSRWIALGMGSLAGIALLMASMGTFGVVAYAVSRRTREIGVRLALGATPRQVQQHMARAGVSLAIPGLVFGLPAAWLGTRTLQGILAGTSPTDPMVFTLVSILLALVAFLASWLPARRAARVDPLVALRAD